MLLQLLPGGRGERGLAINRLPQWLGASRSPGTLQPGARQRLIEQRERVGGQGRFLLLPVAWPMPT